MNAARALLISLATAGCISAPAQELPCEGCPADAGDAEDAGEHRDGGEVAVDGGHNDAGNIQCEADGDGVIHARELNVLRGGTRRLFDFVKNVEVDPRGEALADGGLLWDFTTSYSGTERVVLELEDPATKWFGPAFPGAHYAARQIQSLPVLMVHRVTDGGLILEGVVSPAGGAERIELHYSPEVTLIPLPLMDGDVWQQTADAAGVAYGVPTRLTDRWSGAVTAVGELTVEGGRFAVQRVSLTNVRTWGLTTITYRYFFFVSECEGPVAWIAAQDNEPEPEFSKALEFWRAGF